jgi:hypothetical protein
MYLEDAPDCALVHQLFGAGQRSVEPALESKHDRSRGIAIEIAREFTIPFESSSQRLFEQNAVTRLDQLDSVITVVLRGRDNDRGITNSRLRQLGDRREDGNVASQFGGESSGSLDIGVDDRRKFEIGPFPGQFVEVQGMDRPHPAETGNGYFQRFRHVYASSLLELPAVVFFLHPGRDSVFFDSLDGIGNARRRAFHQPFSIFRGGAAGA